MKAQRSPYQVIRPRPGRRVTGSGNTNQDAYPNDDICPPRAAPHPEDGRAKRSHS